MKSIGITGGVGSGKSAVVDYLRDHYGAYCIKADEAVHILEEPGQPCYNMLLKTFGEGILLKDGRLDKKSFASLIFSDEEARKKANSILHPAVKDYIRLKLDEKKKDGTEYFILEAALLIEEGYDEILDELWYVYVPEDIRRSRLKESRGYSDEKIDDIFASQLSEEEFKNNCRRMIDNSGSIYTTMKQIDRILKNEKKD
ncbi:MAG: dephospho-CoA kinase [Lachnospiraceae bacterium]|nr:dephospho-CoA kinase [Lachnospiraceae bacterium]